MAVAQSRAAGPQRRRRGTGPRSTGVALGVILALALGLRLWSIDHGLPFAYNQDEELHFVPVAVSFFLGSYNPGYFENPPALSYLFHAVFRLVFTEGFPFGAGGFRRAFLADPTEAFLVARVVVALIGTGVVGIVFWAGARFWDRRVGLVAALLMACAFLPVFYSKQALNDVVTLAPLTLGLGACLAAYENGRPWRWALAGGALGAACATKYTAGAMVVCVGLAALLRVLQRRDGLVRAALGVVMAGVAFTLVFLALNPFSLLDFSEFRSQLGGQSAQAGANAKLGQDRVPGWLYYGWTLTWGFGWAPALAAVAGAVLALRRDLPRGLLLVAFPLLFWAFLGFQARWFGRWLLPAYPALAILAAYAAVRLVDALPVAPARRRALLVGVALLLAAQGLVSSVRVDTALGRTDTRSLAREWIVENVPRGSRVVVEPFVPSGWLSARAPAGPELYRRYPVKRPFQAYERKLRPELLDTYRRGGYCWVVVGSFQKQRGLKAGLPGARAYYERLDRESALTRVWSPFRRGAEPVPFSFDLSFNYQPAAYERPGPVVEVHRLGDCEG
jgi:Dolichyl-phosphate-mannose-protein mannosyltransferase